MTRVLPWELLNIDVFAQAAREIATLAIAAWECEEDSRRGDDGV